MSISNQPKRLPFARYVSLDGTTPPANPPQLPPPGNPEDYRDSGVENLLSQYKGNEIGLITKLYLQTGRMRDQRRTDEAEVTRIQGLLPAAGAVVLTGDSLKDYEAYKALGKPADLKSALDAKTTAETDLETLRRDAKLIEAVGSRYNAAAVKEKLPNGTTLEKTGEGKDEKWLLKWKEGETPKEQDLDGFVTAQRTAHPYINFDLKPLRVGAAEQQGHGDKDSPVEQQALDTANAAFGATPAAKS